MLIDTHAHLYWDSFKDDFDEVIKRALDAGIDTVLNIGVDAKTSQVAAKLNSDKIQFYSTIGIHPQEAVNYSNNPDVSIQKDIEQLEKIYHADKSKVVAVGECGLDYQEVDDQIKNLQRKLFQAQINLAKKLNLPLIVHCRDNRSQNPNNSEAWDEVVEMTKSHCGIYHCYSGLPKTTNSILQTNFLISFAGNLTYPKNEYLKEAVKLLPLEKIAIETDCPFLPPQSKRGQRCEPAYINQTAQVLADLKGLSLEEIAKQTTKNVKEILRLRSG